MENNVKTYVEGFREANQNILDCFTGADGGGRFSNYLFIMRDFAEKADNGDDGAKQLVEMVEKFSKLINVLNRQNNS